VQVIDAICINISETDQAIAAVMVTVDAMRCMTRAKRITRSSAILHRRLCHYDPVCKRLALACVSV
jgi:hypothetical protein